MKTRKLRLLSFVLAVAMMFAVMPVSAFATDGKEEIPEDGVCSVTVTERSDSENGENAKSGVQKAIEAKYNITGNDPNRFDGIKNLTVTTASDVELGKLDFQFLSGVKVTGAEGVDCKGEYAGESGSAYAYLRQLTRLDLTDATCENNTFPPRAFYANQKIESVIFPNNLVSSGFKTFATASALKYVGTRAGEASKTIQFPASMTKIGESCFYHNTNLDCTLELPDTLTVLGTNAFECSPVKMEKLTVRSNLTLELPATGQKAKNHNGTFQGTKIKAVEFANGIKEIPTNFIADNSELQSIVIPSSVKTVGKYAFYYKSTAEGGTAPVKNVNFNKDLVIPASVETIGEAAFAGVGNVQNVIVANPDVKLNDYSFLRLDAKIYFAAQKENKGESYACWTENQSTILNTDGGTIATDGNGNVTAKMDATTGLYTPTKDGYKFVGWYDGNAKLSSAAVAGKTYTAHWAELHTVTFNDGVDDSTVKVAHGETVAQPTDPKKDGNKFDGWYKDAAGTQAFNFATDTITDNTIVYAKWIPYETKVEPKVEANADPASKTVEITVNVEANLTELDGATATLNFTDANGNDDSANVAEVAVNGKKLEKNANGKYTANLNDLMNTGKALDASENSAEAVMLADVNAGAVVPGTVKGTALLTVTYKTPGKHCVAIVLNAENGDVICKKPVTVEIAPEPGTLNFTGCTATLKDGTPVENGAKVPVGAEVTVTFEQNADSDLVLNGWKVTPETLTDTNGKLVKDITADTFTFKMPETDKGVTIAAQTKTKATAPAEDDSMDAAAVVTGVVLGTGTAILAYHIGTEVYAEQVLGKGVAIPHTREEVALKAWELAGKPAVELNGEPLSEAAQAETWAVESGLMQNVDGSFNGSKKMSKLQALRTLDAAKKLG